MTTSHRWLLATLLSGLTCLAAHAESAADASSKSSTPPIDDFVRPADFSQMTISPDGKYLAAVVPIADKPHENLLAVLDGKTAKIVRVLHSGSEALIAHYFWVGDNRLVATMAVKHDGLDTPWLTGELFAIDPDGTHQINLFGYRAGSSSTGTHITSRESRYAFASPIGMEPVEQDQILIAINDYTQAAKGSYTEIERLNVRTGRTVRVGASPALNAHLLADHAGQVRVAYADNESTGDVLWLRADNDAPWSLVNDPAKSRVGIVPIGFNRDNSQLYVRVSQGERPDAIELMDVASGKRTRLYQGQFADPGDLLPTADAKDYYAVVTEDGKRALHYFDEDSKEARLSKALAVNFPDQLAYFSSFTRDGKHAIVHVISDRNPGDFYLFDLDSHEAQYLASAKHWIDPKRMRPMQPIELKARDGLDLHGFLTQPAGNTPHPLIVLPHGGPHGIADAWGYDNEVQLFASRGYAVLQINYRGSIGYGGRFQHLGYRQWGLGMQDDLTDATAWAIKQGYADPQRICIYGASYGGYAALEGVVREPELYKCAIGYAGIYDLRVQIDKSDTHKTDRGQAYLRMALGEDRDDLLRRSPLNGAERIKADVLLLHGKDDERVPFKNFQEFTKALDQYGKHYETLVESREGHGFFLPAHREEAYQKMLDFLQRNIGTTSSAPR
ncbi:alpha/beta hydrolase family protein [Dyella subtropica]|uniref:alpha/beta hydrolase family protein n=1 Tax=Dyella subtropica TaxID=2992127 RepID=UPI0022551CD1|nr:S9 family peptidase [Dyella subtropica]